MTGVVEVMASPDYTQVVTNIIAQTSQFIVLSALIVGVVNQVKNTMPSGLKKFMRLIAILIGMGSLWLINKAFIVGLSGYEIAFFGVMMGLSSVGLYEAGLGKKKETIVDFDMSQ